MIGYNAFTIAQARLDEVTDLIGLDSGTHELLRWPQREFAARLDESGRYGGKA